jgi:multidrug efflux pump subunit AcrA (membrane-fusion protein)
VPAYSILRERRDAFVELKQPDGTVVAKHPVTTGITDGLQTEILSGLEEGDLVRVQSPEEESRWRNSGDNAADDKRRRDRMMFRTIGGGAAGGRR